MRCVVRENMGGGERAIMAMLLWRAVMASHNAAMAIAHITLQLQYLCDTDWCFQTCCT